MYSGTPDELQALEQRTHAIAQQIADLLQQLDDAAPGSVAVHDGRIDGLAVTILRDNGRWTTETER